MFLFSEYKTQNQSPKEPPMQDTRSSALMKRSRKVFPGGVNSPVRSFLSVGGEPIVFEKGLGKQLCSVDGKTYTDFCGSWGPLILGYSHPPVVDAVVRQASRALSFGAPCEEELLLAEKLQEWIPGLEMLRFVSSGTEATMSALRVARAATGRPKFIKFEGCYHGHADCLLVKAGSGLATLGAPSSAGVPQGMIEDTLVAAYNSQSDVQELFLKHPNQIAAIIIEPMAANMGLVLPESGFLEFLREICTQHKALLIFDEVMTGCRIAKGGAAETFGVTPDLWTLGKIVGGGLPAAAYGGISWAMQHVSPLGKAYQAGTLSGNPMAMVAGLQTLLEIERLNVFAKLEDMGAQLDKIVSEILGQKIKEGKLCYVRKASFFCFFFGTNILPKNFVEVTKCDMKQFSKTYAQWLSDGIYMGPSGYEVGFLSNCHDAQDLMNITHSVLKSC
jgi:glutamate-1-semialdehyde 2,1-aminomutase